MMDRDKFTAKWERQRAQGRWVYAALHAAVIGCFVWLLSVVVKFTDMPERLTPQTTLYFVLGGFAYGLIRFNIRERFYNATKGQTHD